MGVNSTGRTLRFQVTAASSRALHESSEFPCTSARLHVHWGSQHAENSAGTTVTCWLVIYNYCHHYSHVYDNKHRAPRTAQ